MRSFLLTLMLASGITYISCALNVLIINNAFARPGDTIEVSVSIENTDTFISFQFDLPLPDNVTFLGYSLRMSQRSTNHVAIGNTVGANTLRIFSYSPDNSTFKGHEGEIVSFKLVIGSLRGEFTLSMEKGIIGDSLSQNIITGTTPGILSVFPLGSEGRINNERERICNAILYPNPITDDGYLEFNLTHDSQITLSVFNREGVVIQTAFLGDLISGHHRVDLAGLIGSISQNGFYFLSLSDDDNGIIASKKFLLLKNH